MLRPSLVFSGSALLGVVSLLLVGGKGCQWAGWQRLLPSAPASERAWVETSAPFHHPSQGEAVGGFAKALDPTPLMLHQARLQRQIEQLEFRSHLHQQQVYQLFSDRVDAYGIPHRTPLSARFHRPDPSLSWSAAVEAVASPLAQLSQQIAQDPGNARLYLQRAQLLWEQFLAEPKASLQPQLAAALTPSAVQDLAIAIALDPYLAEAYLLKARIEYERLQQPEQALLTLTPLDRFAYPNPQLHLLRSRIWAEQGHLESAFDVSHLAIELAHHNQNKEDLFAAYVHRGLLWASICDFHLAIQDFSRAIELFPHRGDPYYYRGMAMASLGSHRQQAASDLGRALQLWQASGSGSRARIHHAEAVRRDLLQQGSQGE